MDKLPMCRICLVVGVHMTVVVNKNLHELYEKLTDVPFETDDSRPMLVCLFCCAKLKQCWRFRKKCLEAEELFAQMLIEDHEGDPNISMDNLEFYNGFITTPILHISIIDGSQTTVEEELPAVSESLDYIIDPQQDHQSDKIQLDNVDTGYPDVEDPAVLHSESAYQDVPLFEITKVPDVSIEAPVAEELSLDTRRSTQGHAISAEQMKRENYRKFSKKIMRTQNNTYGRIIKFTCSCGRTTKFKEPSIKMDRDVNRIINNTAHNNIEKGNTRRKKRYISAKDKPFKCDICQRVFSLKSNLLNHNRTHTGEKPFKCDICQRTFSQKSNLVSHTRIHTGEKPFKCEICDRSFGCKDYLVGHARTHTGEKPYKCDICDRSFRHKSNLVTHTLTHTGNKPFKCDLCQQAFATKYYLGRHIRTHTGLKPFKCDICDRDFSRKKHLVSHTRSHTGEKPFKCDACQRCFVSKDHLGRHLRTYSGKTHFSCNICSRSFRYKAEVVNHNRTHTGEEKPFKCQICHFNFLKRSELVTHNRIHAEQKPFKCDICEQRFSRKTTLINHTRTHTGEKPFKCVICHRGFTEKGSLTRHYRTHSVKKPSF